MTTATAEQTLSKKDFQTDQTVRWCPGCGDYAILTAMQNTLPALGRKKEDFVFVSGIGCSSRFPYYMDTYGFHTIHGRAPAVATGVKLANPKLDVWVISGDGDSLSIGGNHFIHAIRRNVGLKYIIFNNEIYGLTKGQYSPTSRTGIITKSTPYGSVDNAFNPAQLAIGAGCTFFARVADTTPKEMTEIFTEAARHKGTAIIEVLQNCVIFNDKVHAGITGREVRADNQLKLTHGQPMIFGTNNDRGIVLDGLKLKVMKLGDGGISEKDILVHDAHRPDPTLAFMLAQLRLPEAPVAMGVLRSVEASAFEDLVTDQLDAVRAKRGEPDLQKLVAGNTTWLVK